jgi:hypothetical protein
MVKILSTKHVANTDKLPGQISKLSRKSSHDGLQFTAGLSLVAMQLNVLE